MFICEPSFGVSLLWIKWIKLKMIILSHVLVYPYSLCYNVKYFNFICAFEIKKKKTHNNINKTKNKTKTLQKLESTFPKKTKYDDCQTISQLNICVPAFSKGLNFCRMSIQGRRVNPQVGQKCASSPTPTKKVQPTPTKKVQPTPEKKKNLFFFLQSGPLFTSLENVCTDYTLLEHGVPILVHHFYTLL